MQINKLVLRNIGAYYGNLNNFDFRTNHNKNVVLLGGKNGAGKTTILESIRIALFGSMAYGFITDNEPYFRKIRSLLNRKAVQANENDFQIALNYISTEEFQPNEYSLVRSWRVKDQKIKEYFSVQKNGQHLNAQEISDFQNRLREEMPPRLFELCLFDGEDISRIVSEERIPEYLRESGKILFNLDLFMNLEKDLQTYRLQYAQKNADAAKEIEEQERLEKEINDLKVVLNEKEISIVEYEEEVNRLEDSIKQDKKDFEVHGGLVQEKRNELMNRINVIENERKTNSDQVRSFINTLLPFHIARKQLEEVNQQLIGEKNYESYEFVMTALEKKKLNQLIQTMNPSKDLLSSQGDAPLLDVDELYNGILEILKPDNIHLLHRASFAQRSEIHNLFNRIMAIDINSYITLFDKNASLLEEAQKLRKAVERNDQSSEFKEILNNIESKTKEAEQFKLLLEQQTYDIQLLRENIQSKVLASSKITDKIREFHKAENSFAMTEKLLTVSRKFRERQWRKKLDDVSNEATKLINILFRKKSYIERMHINHSSFELNLYDKQKQEITKERLSAGEKEMLMLTVILSMFKVSGWKLPFVFDTLLGRLDQDHKKALIQHFIPRCGDQVLIFTTDSEIGVDQFEYIKDITSTYYTLEFNEILDQAEIVKGRYFNISKENSAI